VRTNLASREILGAQIELNSKGLETMQTQLLWRFRQSVNSQIFKISMPIAVMILSTSVWAGYTPPPEQDPPKDPTISTSLILDI
jgi:hypothetical protein